MKLVTWNIARNKAAWRSLLDSDADVALLQEACEPPPDVAEKIDVDPVLWQTDGWIDKDPESDRKRRYRAAVVRLSDRVKVDWVTPKTIAEAKYDELAVSRLGTLALATVTPLSGGAPITVASMYALWEYPLGNSGRMYADASVHRVISDLSLFVGTRHRIIAAGDLNVLYGCGEDGSPYWKARYDSVFDRMKALGLPFVGPQSPNGRFADPWPPELPRDSKNVPTYHHRGNPCATRQMDFVFASDSIAKHVQVAAVNTPEQWGPSDHCQIEITIHETGQQKTVQHMEIGGVASYRQIIGKSEQLLSHKISDRSSESSLPTPAAVPSTSAVKTLPTSTLKPMEPYGWIGGALMLNKTSSANGFLRASWKVQVDPRLTIEGTRDGYSVKDSLHNREAKASTLQAARLIVDSWLQARPEATGKYGIPKGK